MDGISTGQILRGKYRVDKVLGSGGMGVVVLATHLRLDQRVAIKLLRPEARGRADVTERFAREARAASRLRGEHAVRILDVDDSEAGDPFLVMEYLEGSDMQRVVDARGALPITEAVEIALQACEGIAEAHAARIVHRDLKPANLFATTRPDGSRLVKLLDFGISKIVDVETAQEHAITRPDTAIGSPAYMAPEQIKNAGDVDARADIWALGVVLFHLLTADLPFNATTTAALAARIASDPPRDVRALRPEIPVRLGEIIARCLTRERSARFADVAELAAALVELVPERAPSADRIARVLESKTVDVGVHKARGLETGKNVVPSAVEVERIAAPAVAAGPMTASIHDVAATPALEKVLETEYGSTRSTTAGEPPRRRTALAIGAAFVIAGGAVTSFALMRTPSGATPAATPPQLAVSEPSASSADAASSALRVTSSATLTTNPSPSQTPSHATPPRKPRAAPPASAEKKNPMDIDFR